MPKPFLSRVRDLVQEVVYDVPPTPLREESAFPTWDDLAEKGLLCITDIRNAKGSRFAEPGDAYLAVLRNGSMFTFAEGARPPLLARTMRRNPTLSESDVRSWLESGDEIVDPVPDWMRSFVLDTVNVGFADKMTIGRRKTLEPGNAKWHEKRRGEPVTEANVDAIVREIMLEQFRLSPIVSTVGAPSP